MKKSINYLFVKIIFAGIILSAILSLTTCQTLSAVLQDPVVTLQSAELVNITPDGARLLCIVKVDNPNAMDMSYPDITWDLFIGDNLFTSGEIKGNGRIRSRRSVTIDVPIQINNAEILNSFNSLAGRLRIDYKAALAVKFSTPVLGEKVINLEHKGEHPLPQKPRLGLPSMRIESIDATNAVIAFTFNVENPNPFELPTPIVSYDYQVNRTSFLSGKVDNVRPIAASATVPVDLRLQVNFADLLRIFSSLINSREFDGLLVFTVDYGVPVFGEPVRIESPGPIPIPQLPRLSAPSVRIESIDITRAIMVFSVNVENPNAFELPAPGGSYDFQVNRTSFLSGGIDNNRRLTASSVTPIELRLQVNYADLVRIIASIVNLREAACSLTYAFDFGIPARAGPVSFNIPGTLPIPQLPRVGAPSMRVESTDLTRAILVYSFNVENPNAFQLPTPVINYDFQVNRSSFLRGGVDNLGPLAASSTTPISLRLQVSYAELIRSFASLFGAREAASLLVVTSDFGIPFLGGPSRFEISGTLPLR